MVEIDLLNSTSVQTPPFSIAEEVHFLEWHQGQDPQTPSQITEVKSTAWGRNCFIKLSKLMGGNLCGFEGETV